MLLEKIHEDGMKLLKKKYVVHSRLKIKKKIIKQIVKNYHALVIKSTVKIDREVIDNCKKLKLVARAGTGLENIDINYLKKNKIKIISTPLSSTFSVADFTIMLILIAIRHYSNALKMVSKLDFRRHLLLGRNLSNLTIGIVGYGNIGKLVTKLLNSLGAKVLITDPKLKKNNVSLKKIILNSDIITFHLPLTKQSQYLIKNVEINKMKQNVILINTSRAEIFHPEFYKKVNKKFTLYTDVISPEPSYHQKKDLKFKDHPWLKNKNIIFTPHIASMTKETQSQISLELAKRIIKKLK